MEYGYDEYGRRKTICYYDTDEQLVERSDTGYAKIEYGCDEFGRDSFSKYYDAAGQPVIRKDNGCAGYVYQYSGGNDQEWKYIGLDGQPMPRRKGYGIAWVKKVYDPAGNILKESYQDIQEKPAVWKDRGYSSLEYSYYENGDQKEVRCYDREGGLTPWKEKGHAVRAYEYDDCGRILRSLYYDQNLKPVIRAKYHCAGMECEYDERGLAHIAQGYDDIGSLVSEDYYIGRERTQPTAKKEVGCAGFKSVYENGKCVEKRFYDAKGNLTRRTGWDLAAVRKEYDEKNRCILETYYDEHEHPVVSQNFYCAGCPVCKIAGRWYIGSHIPRIVRRCGYGKSEPGFYLHQGSRKCQRRGKKRRIRQLDEPEAG